MKKLISLLFIILPFVPLKSWAAASVSPLSVGILPPVEFPSPDYTITGARFSILWGHHQSMYGLDLGLLGNVTDQTFTGLAISGLFNYTKGTTTAVGLQFAGLTNVNTNKTNVYGVQLAGLLNSNEAESNIVGLQAALIANLSPHTDIYGVQLGLFNKAQTVHGLQLGLVNMTENLHGVQIGLINFNAKGMFGVSPILNVGF